jgi:FKBP-type peptidyl-prolyl cis-trans isomerase SlyD
MEIARNRFVSLSYQLHINGIEGELVEETNEANPLQFVFGAGKMIEMFEKKLEGLKQGDKFSFELKSHEAYGEVNEDAIVDLPKNIFEVNGEIDASILKEGNMVPMQDASGNRLNGIVLEITDNTVKMDFNHPLAGDDLHFAGEVLEVRDATEDELVEASGCDCGSGSCGSGCSC